MQHVNFSLRNTIFYFAGCFFIAIGVALVVRSHLGTSAWDTLHVALANTTPMTIGTSAILVAVVATGLVVILQKHWRFVLMGLPIVFVGVMIDFFDLIVFASFHPEHIVIRTLLFFSALLMMPLGGALLLASTYPAAVFDELMVGLMKLFKTTKLIRVRIALDGFVVLLAVVLTLSINQNLGTLNIGTVLFVVGVGPLLQRYLTIIRRFTMKLNKLIDHTYLKAFGTKEDIDALLEEAIEYDFKSVCINPTWVAYAAEGLKRSDVLVCTVVGFPLGANTTETKVYETEDALKNGADEIDMVVNVGWAKAHQYDAIEKEVAAIKQACGMTTLKVILETCYLTDDEIVATSKAAIDGGADFIKTSTGFGTGGATVNDVKAMASVANQAGVKASGGVKTREDLDMMVEAGATRIGTSSGVALMKGETGEDSY